jgi:hypothetical protein
MGGVSGATLWMSTVRFSTQSAPWKRKDLGRARLRAVVVAARRPDHCHVPRHRDRPSKVVQDRPIRGEERDLGKWPLPCSLADRTLPRTDGARRQRIAATRSDAELRRLEKSVRESMASPRLAEEAHDLLRPGPGPSCWRAKRQLELVEGRSDGLSIGIRQPAGSVDAKPPGEGAGHRIGWKSDGGPRLLPIRWVLHQPCQTVAAWPDFNGPERACKGRGLFSFLVRRQRGGLGLSAPWRSAARLDRRSAAKCLGRIPGGATYRSGAGASNGSVDVVLMRTGAPCSALVASPNGCGRG